MLLTKITFLKLSHRNTSSNLGTRVSEALMEKTKTSPKLCDGFPSAQLRRTFHCMSLTLLSVRVHPVSLHFHQDKYIHTSIHWAWLQRIVGVTRAYPRYPSHMCSEQKWARLRRESPVYCRAFSWIQSHPLQVMKTHTYAGRTCKLHTMCSVWTQPWCAFRSRMPKTCAKILFFFHISLKR